jgi:hypothetical protein
MKLRHAMRIGVASVLVFAWAWCGLAAGAPGLPQESAADEIRQCRRNLRLIHEAIQAYRRVHRNLPGELTELQQRFLSGADVLVCPTARRLGITSGDLTKWGVSGGGTTYGYEFNLRPVPRVISGGSQRTMREWKQIQMGLLGSDVPIVRCHVHEHATLNLTFDGRIFESGTLDWEENFRDVVDLRDLRLARCMAACTVTKKIIVPRRDAKAPAALIDLSEHYNTSLDEAWPGLDPLRPLAGVEAGLTRLSGAVFDLRGAVQLHAMRPGLVPYPAAVTNIVIAQAGRAVHLLLATVHPAAPGTPVAECVFHVADGRQQRFPLEYARHLAACVAPSKERISSTNGGEVAWTSATTDGRTARLYHCSWTNAFSDQVIERLDFVTREGNAGPFLVAISVEKQ